MDIVIGRGYWRQRVGPEARMARHFGQVDKREVLSLQGHFVEWLKEHNVAGSIAGDYSLYVALQEEWHKARENLTSNTDECPRCTAHEPCPAHNLVE